MNKKVFLVISQFNIEGDIVSIESYGEGHINETYLVVSKIKDSQKKYILQRINNNIFTDVDKLMSNISLITEFSRKKIIERNGNPDRESLTVIKTTDNKPYYYDAEENSYYRVYLYIENSVAYQVVENKNDFYQAAIAFGSFANLLAEFDASSLYEVLPRFHDTKKRYNDFLTSVKKDKINRAKEVKEEIDFVLKREKYVDKILSLLQSKKMPLRVTHNDTKLNNVLFDKNSGKYLTVIDLDTIMPGSLCYDFGDSIRFGCNPCLEDERDLAKVNFSIELFESYTKGYLESVKNSIEKIEKDNLVWGAILMTLECGMRFLADYLDGDTYFKINREGQNLDRARTQFKLVSDMEENFDLLNKIVEKY